MVVVVEEVEVEQVKVAPWDLPRDIVKADALMEVNLIRASFGYPALGDFPKGKTVTATKCPVARALRVIGPVNVTPGVIVVRKGRYGSRHVLEPSETLKRFVINFDARQYPELIEW
jgi:hypothetical protein